MILVGMLGMYQAYACDDASFSITSETNNGDGTYTFDYTMCVEFNGLEGNPDWFNLVFVGGGFSTVDSYTPTSVSTSGGDDYTGALESSDTEIRWTTGSIFISHSGSTLCFSGQITTNGRPASIDISYHDTYGPSCNAVHTLPVLCSIDNIAIGTQSACDPGTNTYTQQVTVTYSNPPASGSLSVAGQTFAITSSPQTVTLTSLTADGSTVNFTANFTADTGCSDTSSFTAPASCSASCAADNGTWD